MNEKDLDLDTLLVYFGSRPDPLHGSVIPPIYQTSTFAQESPGVYKEFDYTRTDNPTRSVLQTTLAALESAKHALAFASGMGAVDAALSLFDAGDHIVFVDDIYGGTYRFAVDVLAKRGITFDFVNMRSEESLRNAMKPNTKLIWFESPTNPLLNLIDIEMVVRVAKEHGALTAIDNTFVSPYFQQPLKFGVDIVMHSMTKYINGHSDIVMGALMLNDDALYEKIKYLQNAMGATPSPFDCFLAQRGIKTLGVRMQCHQQNALKVAEFLEKHPKVEKVYYPGLPSHPHHALAKKQQTGFGGMVSFQVASDLEGTKRFLMSTKLFVLAVSLGGVD
ncbi:MAG TPA: PLP-dependent aspartate aminotransferase family protein, partial [Fimbriimonadaceae bacterium]|nr:PLP-dependent aspartate aminotransferase family protein [Fimbriimonadaceae bacterium]